MPVKRQKIIAVIGGSEPSSDDLNLAEEVGRELARHKVVLVCGGTGGVMEAACRGASAEGGITVGVLPGDSPNAANPYVQVAIATGMGSARNIAVVKSAQAVIAVGGAYGTLSEIAHALQAGIPVIGLSTWSLSRKGRRDSAIIPASTPKQAVDKALDMAKER